ncbi:MAG: hypothetical protein NZ704_07825 [Geminicoccaceae bacterium]|nr:hypothetical protein [Geminicoccaceae bacterium]
MTIVRFLVPGSDIAALVEGASYGTLVAATPTEIVVAVDDVLFAHFLGSFDYSSRSRLMASRLDRIEFTQDLERTLPLVTFEELNTTLGTLGRNPARLFAGNDLFVGSYGDDDLTFLEDPLVGRGNDTVRGGAGNDRIAGGPGSDKLFGEEGEDVLFLGPGKDQATGGAGGDAFVLGGGSRGCRIRDFAASAGDVLELRVEERVGDPDAALADPEGFFPLSADQDRCRAAARCERWQRPLRDPGRRSPAISAPPTSTP